MLMLRLLTVIVSVPNALPETVKLWLCSKMTSHSARADQLPAKAHSTRRPAVPPKLLLLLVLVKEAGRLLTVSPGLLVPTQPTPSHRAEHDPKRSQAFIEGNGGGVGGPRCNVPEVPPATLSATTHANHFMTIPLTCRVPGAARFVASTHGSQTKSSMTRRASRKPRPHYRQHLNASQCREFLCSPLACID